MYGFESWTIKKAEHKRIDAFELWCCRRLLPEHQRQQRASGAALLGWRLYQKGLLSESAKEITPNYLRLSQAERERLKKEI